MNNRVRRNSLALAISSALLVAACGGGGGGGGAQLSGIAAEGQAIANGVVTVKDRLGQTRTAQTDASGNYTMNVSGLKLGRASCRDRV